MKVKDVKISLDFMGKPVIQFEAIPENTLEEDAIKAIGTHIVMEKRKTEGRKESLKVAEPNGGGWKNSYLISTFWQS